MKRRQDDDKKTQTAVVLVIGMFLSLILQITKFYIFPAYYFNDAGAVQRLMQVSVQFGKGGTYDTAAFVFQSMNRILPMDTQMLGGIAIWSLAILPCGWIAARSIRSLWEHYILFALYCILLPVFVWNTHKETLQFFFFLLLLVAVLCGRDNSYTADVLIILLTFLWGMLFRSYYMIIAFGIAVFTMLFNEKVDDRNRREMLCLLLVIGVIGLYIIKIAKPALLETLFDSRLQVNLPRIGSAQAKTMLQDLINNPNKSVSLYLVNYLISAIRLLFPFELLFKGVQYVPYCMGQLFWTFMLVTAIKNCFQKGNQMSWTAKRLLIIVGTWYLVAFLFEPDFGSYIRHQTAMYPVMFPLLTLRETACNEAHVVDDKKMVNE